MKDVFISPKALELFTISHCIIPSLFIDGSVLLKSVDLLVLGLCGAFPLDRRENLFQSNKVVVLLDDDRRAVSTDYDGHFYKELICWATQPGQYVLFQHTCPGKDRIDKLINFPPFFLSLHSKTIIIPDTIGQTEIS